MKHVLSTIAALGLLAAGTAANAADAPQGAVYKGAPVYEAVAATSWAGSYVGLQAGWAWGDTHQFADGVGNRSVDFDWDGFVGGATAGFNWQRGMWVYGLEADISFSDIEGTIPTGGYGGCAASPDDCVSAVDWFGTVRGRIGYAMDTFMPYFTGGLAFGRVVGDDCVLDADFCGSATDAGWTIGGGVEWRLGNNWSAKAEYLYVDLGDVDFDVPNGFGNDTQFHVVRGGVNYWFR